MNAADWLRPSSAWSWSACPGYIGMRTRVVDHSDKLALNIKVREEGTAGHWLSEGMLTGQPLPSLGDHSPNGVELSEEIFDMCDEYVDAVRPFTTWGFFRVEMKMDCGFIYPGVKGTGDLVAYNATTHTLAVRDAKFGYKYVPEETPQLTIYGGGAAVALGLTLDASLTVDLGIVQPRCYGTRTHRNRVINGAQLAQELIVLSNKAERAMLPDQPVIAGMHCTDCAARYACPAFAQMVNEGCYATAESDLIAGTPTEVGIELAHLETLYHLMGERIDALEQQAHYMMQNGSSVINYELVESVGREVFTPAERFKAWELARRYGVSLTQPRDITPNQLRKLLPTHQRKAVDAFTTRPVTGTKVKRESKAKAARLKQLTGE